MKRWSTREVARVAGVSPATVSRVLNRNATVAPELSRKVLDAIRSLEEASGTPGDRSPIRKVCIAFPQRLEGWDLDPVGGAFYGRVLSGIDEVLREVGHDHSVFPYAPSDSVSEMVAQLSRFDGIILMGADTPDELAREAAREGLPVIVVDKQVRGVDSVVSDNAGGAEEVTAHVLEQGYRTLIYLCETFEDPSFSARKAGFGQAVEASGRTDLMVHAAELGRGWLNAPAVVSELLDSAAFPAAVVAGNDMTALHIMALARAKGLRIPDQLGLVGFDDVAYASRSEPPLTTVRVDKTEMGRLASRRLLERMSLRDLLPVTITMHVALTVRGSSLLGR